MKIEAIITCVGYGDFLAHTLNFNRSMFDRLVVVTGPEDHHTRRACEYAHVQCVLTDRFQSHWGQFWKGRGINVGLDALEKDGWVVHLDADIALPPMFRRVLESADLDPTFLYGLDRFMVPNFAEWTRFIGCPALQHENGSWVHLNAFPLGTRVWLPHIGGYVPIGFFQMWHPGTSKIASYPEQHSSAARTDIQFAEQWPRNRRAMIPELVAYHLESEKAAHGANWDGRVTAPFGEPPVFRPPVAKPKGAEAPLADAKSTTYGK